MTVDHGMDVVEVENFGKRLQTHFAARINEITNEIESVVGATSGSWVGPDAERFRSWWPAKRSFMQRTSEDIHGFGQAALNNVIEQRRASGERVGVDQEWYRVPTVPGTPSPGGGGGSAIGRLTADPGDLRREFTQEWQAGRRGNVDEWNFYYNDSGNCVSYVAWRLNDIAEERGLDWSMSNNHVGDVDIPGGRLGNAYEWGDHAGAAGMAPTDQASAGAVAWWDKGDGKGEWGHVGVVRSVGADGSITVEESAWGSSVFDVKTYHPGDADYPGGFINLLPSE